MRSIEDLLTIIAVCWWILLIISFTKDRSRYRNCCFLFCALFFTVAALAAIGERLETGTIKALLLVTGAGLLLVPMFLIHNGIVMYKNEGHSLANMLSLIFGVVIGAGEIATIYILLTGTRTEMAHRFETVNIASQVISLSVIYISVSFLIFMFYSVFLMIIPRRSNFDYVIIHGAGLIDGNKVSKLLADRIDKAIDVYKKDPTPTVLIPSGGKGKDELMPEAAAMAAYLREKGIPEDRIIMEDRSATTMENLQFSKKIIDERKGGRYTALVTSNYHVYRALRYCRKIGLECTGIGSRVAMYYWPSALIREYIAVHAERKHLLTFLAGWILVLLLNFAL
jgi:uncharacterized SAM-binding protein YcdF (DUF218 family)